MGKKMGVCLTGGGARGAYQIGALKALEELGMLQDVAAFSGTSIGAANAAVVASRSVDEAYQVWLNLPDDNIPRKPKNKRHPLDINLDYGLYSMDVLEDIVVDAVDYETLRQKEVYATISEGGRERDGLIELLRLSYDYYVHNKAHAQYLPLHELSDEKIHKGIVASASIPIFFSPVKMEGKKYYDGGVFDNAPIKPLIENGCDVIIVIHLHKYRSKVQKDDYPEVEFHEIRHDSAIELGRFLKFSKKQTKKLYAYGYQDTMDYFKNHK